MKIDLTLDSFRRIVPATIVLLMASLIPSLIEIGTWCEGRGPHFDAPAAPETLDATWLARAQRDLADREYFVNDSGQGLQAPNRRQNLRTYFGPDGIRVHDRTSSGSPELVGLSLTALGRGEARVPVSPGLVSSNDIRVEIRRPGLVEWYVNSEVGLEQGFTLTQKPTGDDDLYLDLAVSRAAARRQNDGAILATPTGRKLAYDKLMVVDAKGEAVEARLEVPDPAHIRLVVSDQHAVYPLTIDPLITATSDAQIESNQTSANLGFSVAGAGDVNDDGYADVIVGSDNYDAGQADEGAAFVFLGGINGISSGGPATAFAARIESNQAGARLGYSVSGAGDVNGDGYGDVIVGANFYDAGQTDEGAAFVFLGSASGILDGSPATAVAQLESNQANAYLGTSVAGAGDVNGDGHDDVIVAANYYDAGQIDEGAAFVFLGSAVGPASGGPAIAATQLETNQTNSTVWSASSAGDVNGDGFDDVIIGAPYYDEGGTDTGVAFVFLGGVSGISDGNPATAPARLESKQSFAYMGWDVAGAGDVNGDGYADVIAGAQYYDAGQADEGAAFVFLGGVAGIGNGDPLTASAQIESDQVNAHLGISVAGAGDVNGDGYADVIVGNDSYDAGQIDEGAAFVFFGSAFGVPDSNPSNAAAQLESNQVDARLSFSVAGAGDVNGDGYADIIVGAYRYDAGEANEGAAFVYLGGASGIVDGDPASSTAQIESNQALANMGWSVAGAGDVNGDGYADVIVGAYSYDTGQSNGGAAFVYLGSAAGIANGNPNSASARLESDQADSLFGWSVAGAGDIDGDGYADIVVGAPQYSAGQASEGAAFVFRGSEGGISGTGPASALAQFESDQSNVFFGWSVAGAGDVNGDGFADILIGARRFSAGQTEEGAAFVFFGGAGDIPDGNPGTAASQLESDLPFARLGTSVAGAGDVNGDGYADVIVGADGYDAGQTDEGGAFLFLGSGAGIADSHAGASAAKLESNQQFSGFGISVAGAGDVNGDGFADIVVGAPFYDAGSIDGGAAFVFLGSASGISDGDPASAAAQIEGNQPGAQLGRSVSGAGDVNGDGFADVILGAPTYVAGQVSEGAAFVFAGGVSGVLGGNPTGAMAQLESNQTNANLGVSIAGTGDVNDDGFADVVVGSPGFDAGDGDEGGAFVFLSNRNRGGREIGARQTSLGGGPNVSPEGTSTSSEGFRAELRGNHPQGAGFVRGKFETCPSGVAFGGPGCSVGTSAWFSVSAASPDITLSHEFVSLVAGVLYKWRARVEYGPRFGLIPETPAHGPWRRLDARATTGDIRTLPLDSDGDNLSDPAEIARGTNPNDPDSDDDGLSDGDEVVLYRTDPLDSDSDDDGLSDGVEAAVYGTNPRETDTDGDALSDGAEVNVHGTNPISADSDGDAYLDGVEVAVGTNPNSSLSTPCGNGILEGPESCDDGDRWAGDGCSAVCGVQAGHACSGSPSVCIPIPRLTSGGTDVLAPDVSETLSVWRAFDGVDYEVYATLETGNVQITNDSRDDLDASVSGSNVAWRAYDGSDYEIWLWNGTTSTRLTSNAQDDLDPHVSGSNVAWRAFDGNDYEAWVWNGTSSTQLTNNAHDDLDLQISGSNVVWRAFDGSDYEIWLWNGTTSIRLTNNAHDDRDPRISGSNVAWREFDGSNYDIWLWNGTSSTRLTNNANDDLDLRLSGSSVAWREFDGNDYEIGLWNGAAATRLTNNARDDLDPRVSGSNVVWREFDGNDYEVWLWNNTASSPLTSNARDDLDPQISGSSVVWREFAGTAMQVGFSTASACSDSMDNDGDGTIDFDSLCGVTGADCGCRSVFDVSERDQTGAWVCDNQVDEDADGFVDFPDDVGCTSALGATEVPEPTALSAILSGAGFLFLARRRKNRRSQIAATAR